MTIAPSPSIRDHLKVKRRSSSGMIKAKVLPEPVLAAPRTSSPRSANDIDSRWISVGSENPDSASPFWVFDERGKSLKDFTSLEFTFEYFPVSFSISASSKSVFLGRGLNWGRPSCLFFLKCFLPCSIFNGIFFKGIKSLQIFHICYCLQRRWQRDQRIEIKIAQCQKIIHQLF